MTGKLRCKCGAYARPKSGLCSRCLEIDNLKKTLEAAHREMGKCSVARKALEAEVTQLNSRLEHVGRKAKFPIWFHIQEGRWSCNEDYLRKLLATIAPVSDCVIVEYGRNK